MSINHFSLELLAKNILHLKILSLTESQPQVQLVEMAELVLARDTAPILNSEIVSSKIGMIEVIQLLVESRDHLIHY